MYIREEIIGESPASLEPLFKEEYSHNFKWLELVCKLYLELEKHDIMFFRIECITYIIESITERPIERIMNPK